MSAPRASSPAVRKSMQGNRSRDTKPEVRLRSEMHRLGLRFRKHHRPLPRFKFTADAVFPRERVAVFLDGCFWHACPEHGRAPAANSAWWSTKLASNSARDHNVNTALAEAGWAALRFWEHEDPAQCAARVLHEVLARRATLRNESEATEEDSSARGLHGTGGAVKGRPGSQARGSQTGPGTPPVRHRPVVRADGRAAP